MRLIILLVLDCLCSNLIGQSDTIAAYLAKDGGETAKENAYTQMRFYKVNNTWHGKESYLKSGVLKSEGDYADSNVKTPIGTFNNYTETGKLDFVATYTDGEVNEITYYNKRGTKKSWIAFENKKVKQQKGWDESGKELKDFVVAKPASFKSGSDAWSKYLKKNLGKIFNSDATTPAGTYNLEVNFIVTRMGYTSKAKVTSKSGVCKICETEAVRIILESPEWTPAIKQNEPTDSFMIQPFVFQVHESTKNKK